MRLADDTRGRVPFALVGVLLLLGSTTYAGTLATDGIDVDRDVDVAMDRATAATETALRVAVSRAARDAARSPVAVPASSNWGDVLNDSRPFRDGLRVRLYVAARDGFDRSAYTHGDVTAAASLPATPTPAALHRELDRVSIRGVENDTALEVTVHDVSVVARENGRVVARETTNRTVTVATPVLALHDRTVRFERSLERGPLEGPGLGRRLTARLYPIAWARGYGQWSGLPVSNVVGTRHVGVTANGAVLELQQAAYGRADPTGRTAQGRALQRFVYEEGRAGMSTLGTDVATSIAPPPTIDPDDAPTEVPQLAPEDAPTPDRTVDVGVNETADRAFVGLQDGSSGPSLDDVLERAYRVNLTLRTEATLVETEPWPRPQAPSSGADLEDETVRSSATVEPGSATLPSRDSDATRFDATTHRVTVRHRIAWTWRRGNTTTDTSATVVETYAVGVAVDGSLPALEGTPQRPVEPVFERGGALDGPNLADVPAKTGDFLATRGGAESIAAQRVVEGSESLDRNGTVVGERPPGLREWVSDDLLALHGTVRNTSTAVRMGDAATGRANPPRRLAAALDEDRRQLVDVRSTYDGAADRARIAARAAYLDRVQTRLSARSEGVEQANNGLTDRLREEGVNLTGRARAVFANRTANPPTPRPAGGSIGGRDVFVPQGGPPYLDVQGVERADVPWTDGYGTAYALETRNVNVFTVPYGDAADAVVGSSPEEAETVRLHTAAMTLRAAERATGSDTPELAARHVRLDGAVVDVLDTVSVRTRAVLARETALSRADREHAVDDAFGTWNGTAAKAVAVTNGSFVSRVVAETGVEGEAAVRLRIALRAAVADLRATGEARVAHDRVDDTVGALRRVSTTVATEAIGTAVANGTERLDDRMGDEAVVLPAGLPLLPTPTNWYATVNVWDVHVRGEYPRFAVRTQRGAPGETVTYVRDGGRAALDVDEDGNAEWLGNATRVDLSIRTVILVAVPPGKTGVGDTDGQAIEDSPGWEAASRGEATVTSDENASNTSVPNARTVPRTGRE